MRSGEKAGQLGKALQDAVLQLEYDLQVRGEIRQALTYPAVLVVAGRRVLPRQLGSAVIHRLELPQGRFERRVPLPPGRYAGVGVTSEHGCLVISLQKSP